MEDNTRLKKLEKLIKSGKWVFILKFGILGFGVPVALFGHLTSSGFRFGSIYAVLGFFLSILVGGILFGATSWKYILVEYDFLKGVITKERRNALYKKILAAIGVIAVVLIVLGYFAIQIHIEYLFHPYKYTSNHEVCQTRGIFEDECYYGMATKYDNISLCNKIISLYRKNKCLEHFNTN